MEFEIFKKHSRHLAYEVSSLKNCAEEPIAFCGAIQPNGLLVVVDCHTLMIRAASDNWQRTVGVETQSMLGKSLTDFLLLTPEPKPEDLCHALSNGLCTIALRSSPLTVAEGSCYRAGDNFVIEFEFDHGSERKDLRLAIKKLLLGMRGANSITDVCAKTAQAIRDMSGYDRVMIYRFDADWNGQVIAEARQENLEPLLHLRYPASDIPPQARRLFFENQSRMIVDIEAEASPILTNGFHPGELDLSHSLLRAVSPIHIQYLTNMGVRASFSAPIRVSDQLWGLISCHHYSGKMHPGPETRYMFELTAQITSGKIADLLDRKRLQIKTDTLLYTQALLADVSSGKTAAQALQSHSDKLLKFTDATSAHIKIGGEQFSFGRKIAEDTVSTVVDGLRRTGNTSVWKSNSLALDLKSTPDPSAAGALAVPLSMNFQDFIIWFRPEEVQEVRWGGKPQNKESPFANTLERLSPRRSFAEWREKLEFHSRPWSQSDVDFSQYFQIGFVQGLFAKARALSDAYSELERVAKSKDEFIGTISHELRTPLSIIVGWINILNDYEQPSPEAEEAVRVIDRNARIQIKLIDDLLDASRIIAGKLRLNPEPNLAVTDLVASVVQSLGPTAQAKTIELKFLPSEQIRIPADPDRLRQVVWNLLTNAIKFTPKAGKVTVSVTRADSSCIITVKDNGIGLESSKLQSIFDRFSQAREKSAELGGLGLGLSIVKSIVELHAGTIQAFSEGDGKGSKFVVSLPFYALEHKHEPETLPEKTIYKRPRSTLLEGMQILVAEDQPDSIAALKILLERESATVTAVKNGAEALQALKSKTFDLILSDIGMPELDGNQLLRAWRAEELKFGIAPIPAIALTAYATSKDRITALQSGFQNHIAKPVDQTELLAVIDAVRIRR